MLLPTELWKWRQKPVKARVYEESGHKINEVQTRFNGKTLNRSNEGRHRNGRGLNYIRFPMERGFKIMSCRQTFCI